MPFWRRRTEEPAAPVREVGEPVDPDLVDPSWEPLFPSFEPHTTMTNATQIRRLPNGVVVVRLWPGALKIEIPDERRRSDDFYLQVAGAFSVASAMGQRPAVRIADANGVPVSTVHRWVKEARRRGVMGPARSPQRTQQEQP